MFSALNRFIARLDLEPGQQQFRDNPHGFQVLRNKDPELLLEPWFDFVIGINGHLILTLGQDDPDPNLFATEIRNCAGSSVTFEVWSAKGQRTYTTTIAVPSENPTLGVTFQFSPLSATQHIWHITEIPSPLSPAYQAGLLPHSDYILGTPSGTLRGESALGELVEDHLNRSLVLWVYNSEFDVVREVELVPRRGWGGEGALGAVLGYGALHRLPFGLGEAVEGPGEVVFETKDKEEPSEQNELAPPDGPGDHFLVPANMASPPLLVPPSTHANIPSAAPAKHGRKPRHAHHGGNLIFDDYFREGEQRSKEEDFVPSWNASPIPPPPKAGRDPVSPPPTTATGGNDTVE
ncbi:golgi reassembly stacking protein [Histoplasma capsulatum]|uniref:Golgi reassembly stacking protein n=1 Tax=Ajellomyces capsulatus TaxID=5037 RepID=A0A8A1M5U2_AJECA|nr:golgi reassembly stacking protein [Histoplasma capsulatum]